jgi:hypothetical protein
VIAFLHLTIPGLAHLLLKLVMKEMLLILPPATYQRQSLQLVAETLLYPPLGEIQTGEIT